MYQIQINGEWIDAPLDRLKVDMYPVLFAGADTLGYSLYYSKARIVLRINIAEIANENIKTYLQTIPKKAFLHTPVVVEDRGLDDSCAPANRSPFIHPHSGVEWLFVITKDDDNTEAILTAEYINII